MANENISVEEIYRANRKRCLRFALALEAVGIPYQIFNRPGQSMIVVPASVAERARAELAEYETESISPPIPVTVVFEQRNGWIGVFGYTLVLSVMFFIQRRGMFGEDWVATGRTHAGLICQGELWRTVTALTLHSNTPHLLANIVFGGLIGLFAGRLFGSGLAWFGILIAGAGGNLLNALIRNPEHTTIGASTAVFAAFGMMAAFSAIHRQHIRPSKFGRYTPIVGGMILLSFLGTSGERTDVLAHVTGFIAGLLLGTILGKSGVKVMPRSRTQLLFGIGSIALIVTAWFLAVA